MKTKIVYTLVSHRKGVYLGQAIISAYTARLYNPYIHIVMVTDIPTGEIISQVNNNYFDEVVIVDVPSELSEMQASRFLKTTLRQTIKGDYLFIDTDTVIVGDLSECDSFTNDISAVLDRHSLFDKHPMKIYINEDLKKVEITSNDLCGKYYNSGVMFVKDNAKTHMLYEYWKRYWDAARKKGYNIDQPPLAKANKECGYIIQELSGIWNCQMVDNFINIMVDAKILHYFASHRKSPYKLYDDALLKEVAREGVISDALKKELETPKALFREKHLLVHDDDVDFCHTYLHALFAYKRGVYNIFESFARFLVTKRLK